MNAYHITWHIKQIRAQGGDWLDDAHWYERADTQIVALASATTTAQTLADQMPEAATVFPRHIDIGDATTFA